MQLLELLIRMELLGFALPHRLSLDSLRWARKARPFAVVPSGVSFSIAFVPRCVSNISISCRSESNARHVSAGVDVLCSLATKSEEEVVEVHDVHRPSSAGSFSRLPPTPRPPHCLHFRNYVPTQHRKEDALTSSRGLRLFGSGLSLADVAVALRFALMTSNTGERVRCCRTGRLQPSLLVRITAVPVTALY